MSPVLITSRLGLTRLATRHEPSQASDFGASYGDDDLDNATSPVPGIRQARANLRQIAPLFTPETGLRLRISPDRNGSATHGGRPHDRDCVTASALHRATAGREVENSGDDRSSTSAICLSDVGRNPGHPLECWLKWLQQRAQPIPSYRSRHRATRPPASETSSRLIFISRTIEHVLLSDLNGMT